MATTTFGGIAGASSAGVLATASAGVLATTASSAAATSSSAAAIPSEIKDLSLDEVVNKWTEEIADLAARFQKGARMVSKWDREIVSNEDKIHSLYRDAESVKTAYKELSDNLDLILSQQNELHSLLDTLQIDVERKIGSSPSKTGSPGQGNGDSKLRGDVERESMHRMSIEVMEELDSMALTIRNLVVDLNKGSELTGGDRAGDTVSQIISVLNAHLDSLQYLDETSSALHRRLTDVQRACEVATRETERMYGRRTAGMY